MSFKNDTIYLKNPDGVAFEDEVTEFLLSNAKGMTAHIQVKRTDTMSNVRYRVENCLDSTFFQMSSFAFVINCVVLPKSEESNTFAWQYSGKRVMLKSMDSSEDIIDKSKPALIMDDE